MGYDGGGLGKSGQGRTEPIPFSTQRGREGLGQLTNQVMKIDFFYLVGLHYILSSIESS